MHFARLASTQLKDGESARDNHVLAGNFAKYSPILKMFHSHMQGTVGCLISISRQIYQGIFYWKYFLSLHSLVDEF